MSNGRIWRVVNAARGVPIQRGCRPLEWSDGHGQRSRWTDGQLERVSFARQNFISVECHDLPGPVSGVGGCQ